MIHQGQSMDVSIPALMSSLPGTVEAVHMVSRITPEGTKLFSADILVENEGALTAEMAASATVTTPEGETVYPYEPGKLEYYRTGDLCSTVNGTVGDGDDGGVGLDLVPGLDGKADDGAVNGGHGVAVVQVLLGSLQLLLGLLQILLISYSLIASQNDNCLILPIQCVRTTMLEDGSDVYVVFVEGDRPENAVEVMVNEEIPKGFWAVPVEIGIQDNYNIVSRPSP